LFYILYSLNLPLVQFHDVPTNSQEVNTLDSQEINGLKSQVNVLENKPICSNQQPFNTKNISNTQVEEQNRHMLENVKLSNNYIMKTIKLMNIIYQLNENTLQILKAY